MHTGGDSSKKTTQNEPTQNEATIRHAKHSDDQRRSLTRRASILCTSELCGSARLPCVQIRNTARTKRQAGLHRLRRHSWIHRQKNKMNQRLTYEEKRILRDLSAGQSTVDAIALRFGQTASTIQKIMDRLEKHRMVGSKTINNGKYTVYELR